MDSIGAITGMIDLVQVEPLTRTHVYVRKCKLVRKLIDLSLH